MKTDPKTHDLKCWPEYFEKVLSGEKTFEVRLNDRNYKIGDTVVQHEWNPVTMDYTGRVKIMGEISYILSDYEAIRENFVVFGFSSLKNRSLVEENKRLNDIFAANEADITRVEVIEDGGRTYVNWKPENKVKILLQDNGRTLKIFVSALSYKEETKNG